MIKFLIIGFNFLLYCSEIVYNTLNGIVCVNFVVRIGLDSGKVKRVGHKSVFGQYRRATAYASNVEGIVIDPPFVIKRLYRSVIYRLGKRLREGMEIIVGIPFGGG